MFREEVHVQEKHSGMRVSSVCPMCKRLSHIDLTEKESQQFLAYKDGEFIQVAMPDTDDSSREFFISGFCHDCMSLIFGSTSERICYSE